MFKKFFLLLFVFFLGGVALHAQTREELQKRKQEIMKELDELNLEYSKTQSSKKISLKQLALIKKKINARQDLVNDINKEVKQLDETIYLNERDIYRLKKELDTLKMKYAKSIVFAYKNRSSYAYLNFLFSAGSFNDAIKRVEYLKSYRRNRETQANTIIKSEALLKDKIGVLSNNKKERLSTLQVQSKQLLVLQEDKKEQDQVVAQLKGREKELNAQIKEREKQRQKVQLAINAVIRREIDEARKRDEAKRQKALEDQRRLQAAAKPSDAAPKSNGTAPKVAKRPADNEPATAMNAAPKNRSYSPLESTPEGMEMSLNFENNKGRLPWPVSNGVVTIDFGITQMEGTKLNQKSDGIEIAVPVGSAVRCVADGEVVSTTEIAGEMVVLVKHGKYFTGYKNLSSVNVSRGQDVKAGSVLGKSGTSIDGDGAILFMIMNDRAVFQNPKPWLKSR
ncbi:MAG TPA: peptidoglycan DD-metalloendopeptidase family protein [Sediminibacterium sp.]|nr:peptidoglycan DD-metalloendopeptidase family protein [Sediminibacterium sp.]